MPPRFGGKRGLVLAWSTPVGLDLCAGRVAARAAESSSRPPDETEVPNACVYIASIIEHEIVVAGVTPAFGPVAHVASTGVGTGLFSGRTQQSALASRLKEAGSGDRALATAEASMALCDRLAADGEVQAAEAAEAIGQLAAQFEESGRPTDWLRTLARREPRLRLSRLPWNLTVTVR
jgi:hypothetical protein